VHPRLASVIRSLKTVQSRSVLCRLARSAWASPKTSVRVFHSDLSFGLNPWVLLLGHGTSSIVASETDWTGKHAGAQTHIRASKGSKIPGRAAKSGSGAAPPKWQTLRVCRAPLTLTNRLVSPFAANSKKDASLIDENTRAVARLPQVKPLEVRNEIWKAPAG